ncbi:MAG TPA: universal stress protein [Rhizomicrobium sp.]|nr:universal stress protein [Rhizomicrobium sp.]
MIKDILVHLAGSSNDQTAIATGWLLAHTHAAQIRWNGGCNCLERDVSSDLLVMGGYGHSRTRELIFGGFTRAVLHEAKLPVLLTH